MAKKDPETAARRGKLRELIKEYNVKTMEDVHNLVKMLYLTTMRVTEEWTQPIHYRDPFCKIS